MFKSMFTLALFAAAASAQGIEIGFPEAGQAVSAGQNLAVQLDRPYFPVDSQEVAVVIGLQSCQDSPCQSTSSDLGTILYNGPYDPESYKVAYEYENITVAVPSDTSTGTAVLGVLHVSVVGPEHSTYVQTLNVTINVV